MTLKVSGLFEPSDALPVQYKPAKTIFEHSGMAPFSVEKVKFALEELKVLEFPSTST